jgi:hypothetical protein
MLAAAYDHIHAANPQARVLLGGIMDLAPYGGAAYLDKVFATPGADAIHKFDVANVHIRGSALQAGRHVDEWREYLSRAGFYGPIWVTEHGYPSDPAYQTDRNFRGGERAQADFLATSVPLLTGAGAAKVFVTLRDALHDRYASEGVLRSDLSRKPAFYTLQTLAFRYAQGPVSAAEAVIGARPALVTHVRATVKLRARSRKLTGRVGGSRYCRVSRVRVELRAAGRWRGVRRLRVRARRFGARVKRGRYRVVSVRGRCAPARSKIVRVA